MAELGASGIFKRGEQFQGFGVLAGPLVVERDVGCVFG